MKRWVSTVRICIHTHTLMDRRAWGLQHMESQRVGHDRVTEQAHTHSDFLQTAEMLFKKHFQSKNQIHDFPSLLRAVLEPAYSNCLYLLTFYRWLSRKESACQSWRLGFNPWVRKIPWRRKRQPTPVFLPGKSHGQRSLADYSPWGCKESDTTEQLNNTKSIRPRQQLD